MAVKHPINRIQVAVSPSTTSKHQGSPYIDTESKASDHIGSRNQVITTKTGHRSGTRPRPVKLFIFFRYFLIPKKDGGIRPILDLRDLNVFLKHLPFHMLRVADVIRAVNRNDWFVTIDLTDAYYHIPIVAHHRRFLCFHVNGVTYQFRVLPFGLALAPRTFTKCVRVALEPLCTRRHAYPPLPRRLVTVRSVSTPSATADKVIDTAYRSTRSKNKLLENLYNSCSDSSVHWLEARLVLHASHFDRGQISGNCKDGCKISNRQAPTICKLSPSSWSVGGSNTSGAAGNAATPTSSTLAEFTTPISYDPKACFGSGDSSMFSHSETLVPQRSSSQRCSLGSPSCKES